MSNCFRRLSLLTLAFLLTCCFSSLRAQDSAAASTYDTAQSNQSTGDTDSTYSSDDPSGNQKADTTYHAFIRWKTGSTNVQVQSRHLPSSTIDTYLKNSDYWYVPVGPGKKPAPEKPGWWDHFLLAIGRFFSHRWVWFMFISLVVGLLTWGLVYVIQAMTGESLFRRKPRRFKEQEAEELTVETSRDKMHEAIAAAIKVGDYTMAIRYLFLVTLGELEDKGLIQQMKDASNRQYVRALTGKPIQGAFSRLLLYYEYSFYGGFNLDTELFQSVHQQFNQFHQQLKSL